MAMDALTLFGRCYGKAGHRFIPLIFVVFGISLAVCDGAQTNETFVKNTLFNERVCNVTERVGSHMTRTRISCAKKCEWRAGCLSFFYNDVTSECYGCDRVYSQVVDTDAAPGMVYYSKTQEATTTTTSTTTTTTTTTPTTTTTTPTTTTTTPTTTTTTTPTTTTTGTNHVLKTCWQLHLEGATTSGVYNLLSPITLTPISVYCEMNIQGGGWMVWQHRFHGALDFKLKTFLDYENGFGDPADEHWLGLKYQQEFLASRPSDVYLQFTDFTDVSVYEWFYNMSLSAAPLYTLTLGPTKAVTDGTTTYGLRYNANQPFSTKDNVQNAYPDCPITYEGGWWYFSCNRVNVNGQYGIAGDSGYPFNYNLEWQSYNAMKATKCMYRETSANV